MHNIVRLFGWIIWLVAYFVIRGMIEAFDFRIIYQNGKLQSVERSEAKKKK